MVLDEKVRVEIKNTVTKMIKSGHDVRDVSESLTRVAVQLMAEMNEIMDRGTLVDWYVNSVSPDVPPIWTEEHIDELLTDFHVIPKEDVQ